VSNPKKPLPPNAKYAALMEEIQKTVVAWKKANPDGRRSIAGLWIEDGTLMAGFENAAPCVMRAALYPQDLRDEKNAELRQDFFIMYAACPDFMLTVLARLRAVEKRTSPIRKFFREFQSIEVDGKPIPIAQASDAELRWSIKQKLGVNVSLDAVKAERQFITALATKRAEAVARYWKSVDRKREERYRAVFPSGHTTQLVKKKTQRERKG
jgi:hypothetical protein